MTKLLAATGFAAAAAVLVVLSPGHANQAQAENPPGTGPHVVGYDMDPYTVREGAAPGEGRGPGNCRDTIDNDSDTLVDGADPECDTTCADGIDNDGDTLADANGNGILEPGEDPQCEVNSDTHVGRVDSCISVPNTPGYSFDVDTFVDMVPANETLDGFNYFMSDTTGTAIAPGGPLTLTAQNHNMMLLAAAGGGPLISLSEPVPEPPDSAGNPGIHNIAEADLGAPEPGGSVGVMGRYTFSVNAGAAPGAYPMIMTGLAIAGRGANADWTFRVTDLLDANYAPPYGSIALGVPCDRDGDALFDAWEERGLDWDGDTNIDLDLPAMGADPNHKDIFVEIDSMDCTVAGSDCPAGDTHNHEPMAAALTRVREAFADAPINNPFASEDGVTPRSCADSIDNDADGKGDIDDPDCRGITLHTMTDERLPHSNEMNFPERIDPRCPATSFNTLKTAHFGTPGERADPNKLAAKRQAFRYAIFAHRQADWWDGSACKDNGSCGCAEGRIADGGNDLLVTLGEWTAGRGDQDEQEGAFMHELGHTLGLHHGGNDTVNCKPNYLSVMSYSRTMNYDWFVGPLMALSKLPLRSLDYSRSVLNPLDERAPPAGAGLTEGGNPIGGTSREPTAFSPLDASGWPRVAASNGDTDGNGVAEGIDWNNIGGIGGTVGADINDFDMWDDGDPAGNGGCDENRPNEVHTGFNDWANLDYNFRDSVDFADGVHTTPHSMPDLTNEQVAPFLTLARSDPDGDGIPTVDELINGTDPFSPDAVGGILELPVGQPDSPARAAEGSGSAPRPYAAIAGGIAAAALAITATGWYARRRWLR